VDNRKKYIENYNFEWKFTDEQKHLMDKKWDYISQLIPRDVQSIIDIGCGEGFFTNRFLEKYQTIGVDINKANLDKIKCKTIHSLAHEIQLEKNSIDLVFSSEMLEHLPNNDTLQKTTDKIKEIAKKYILITVPNQQNLNNNSVKCEDCGNIFNSSLHYFSFNQRKLEYLFSGFNTIHFDTIGRMSRPYTNNALLFIRNRIANNWSMPNQYTTCPKCGNNKNFVHKINLISKFCHAMNFIVDRKKREWIIILFEK
jgi:SAM-dependent methyltransferase